MHENNHFHFFDNFLALGCASDPDYGQSAQAVQQPPASSIPIINNAPALPISRGKELDIQLYNSIGEIHNICLKRSLLLN